MGWRNQDATTGYYGTFASANGGSNGQINYHAWM